MERTIAIKKLGKLLGKHLGYRIDSKAPTPEQRVAARAELVAANAERDSLKKKRDERYTAVLAADTEYQKLHAEHRAAHDRAANLLGTTYRRKFTVGTSNGMFFSVKAEGDSWEEVIDKVSKKEST